MKLFYYIIILLISISCAQQTVLTGGNKDLVAPILDTIKTIPSNYSVNFNSKTINIVFNEYINLKSKDIVINPPIKNENISLQGRNIIIKINEDLETNTTYTLNFISSISDITENNILENFKYIFSTGNFLDSAFYQGVVVDAFTKRPLNNIKVFLYEKTNTIFPDSSYINTPPKYIGISNEEGRYKINNIKHGNYYIIACDDKNKNNKLDYSTEKLTIKYNDFKTLINPDSSINDTLNLFENEKNIKIISKRYIYPAKVELVFNKKINNARVSRGKHIFFNEKVLNDTLIFWINNIDSNKLDFNVEVENFNKNINLNLTHSKEDTVLKLNKTNINNIFTDEPLRIEFNSLLSGVDLNKIILIQDSVEIDIADEINSDRWLCKAKFLEKISYSFTALPGAFTGEYGLVNDTIKLLFSPKITPDYANIYLNINKKNSNNIIIELLKNNKVSKTIYSENGILSDTLTELLPGNYKLRVIDDLDNNALWSTGNIEKKKLPENVYYYPEPIEIKANWDVDINWKIKD